MRSLAKSSKSVAICAALAFSAFATIHPKSALAIPVPKSERNSYSNSPSTSQSPSHSSSSTTFSCRGGKRILDFTSQRRLNEIAREF
ncbi:hypothetical protein HZC07_04235, partial [Candidatus Micrarchaeota archaeon]|nr:hypothetical protein [Candidatus Micrarchaeota archaeon]